MPNLYLRPGASSPNDITLRDPTLPDSGMAYTLTAQYGAFALTAETLTLVVARLITASQASFTMTAETASVVATRLVTASYGAFTLTGETAGLTVARFVTASYGAFAVSAETAALEVDRLLTAEPATYTITYENATLLVTPAGGIAYSLVAQPTTFAISAGSASLVYNPVAKPISAPALAGWGGQPFVWDKPRRRKLKPIQVIPPAPEPKPEPRPQPVGALFDALQRLGTRPRKTMTFKSMDLEPLRRSIEFSRRKTRERRDREAIEV